MAQQFKLITRVLKVIQNCQYNCAHKNPGLEWPKLQSWLDQLEIALLKDLCDASLEHRLAPIGY